MSVSAVGQASVSQAANQENVAVIRKVQDQIRIEGQQAVTMIQATAPPGTGQHINVLA